MGNAGQPSMRRKAIRRMLKFKTENIETRAYSQKSRAFIEEEVDALTYALQLMERERQIEEMNRAD